jgi:folate-binding protein YgfZ
MDRLKLHEFHEAIEGCFIDVNGMEAVSNYGDALAEHAAITENAGVLDLSFRSRLCLTGADRVRFLHGQVTNDIKSLRTGEGCYAAVVTAKGRMQSDLNIYCLADELLLDFEPGLTITIAKRLDKYIVADDVQVVEISPQYGLLSVQGPRASEVVVRLGLFGEVPVKPFNFLSAADATLGELYLVKQPRFGTDGFDLYVPVPALDAVADKLVAAARSAGGRACGWQALEMARIEAGIPRFGLDMDESNLPQECGIESQAVSYSKGCYIGQEVLNRIHTLGHVNRELRGLRLEDDLKSLPEKDAKLFHDGKEIGSLTSVLASPRFKSNIALSYVRREVNQVGTELTLRSAQGESAARVVQLPFGAGEQHSR